MTREEDYMARTEHAVNHAKRLSTEAEPSARLWQPIETAPRDGTAVDLWVHWPEHGEDRRVCDAHWNAADGEWQLGQYHVGQFMHRPVVTHWMPLAAPPGEQSQ